jgi:cyanamide hydratase
MSKTRVEEYGWTAVPRNRSNMPSPSSAKTTPVPVSFDSIWPQTSVVKKAQDHVKNILPTQTYNHSLRVYCYGHTLVSQHFPEWISACKDDFFETWALTCLYHDIATTDEHRGDTHMSFEWHGGFMALQELQGFGAPRAQAESVCEAIIRHQDPGETGTISRMGQLVQLATEFGEWVDVLCCDPTGRLV